MIVIIILLVAIIALILGINASSNSSPNGVITANTVGLIRQNVILPCTFTPDDKKSSTVLWERIGDTGIVYKYENGKIVLTNQNPNFKSRTSLFLNQMSAGNASLTIADVQMNDAGVYRCTITNSNGQGQDTLSLSVGAFSELTVTNISQTILRCNSPTWLPEPTVSWLNVTTGNVLTNVSTVFVPGLSHMVGVISEFHMAEENIQYRCVITNKLARAEGDAILTDFGLQTQTRLVVSRSAQISSPSGPLLCLLILTFPLGAVNL